MIAMDRMTQYAVQYGMQAVMVPFGQEAQSRQQ